MPPGTAPRGRPRTTRAQLDETGQGSRGSHAVPCGHEQGKRGPRGPFGPLALVICGVPASGKTTLADAAARSLGLLGHQLRPGPQRTSPHQANRPRPARALHRIIQPARLRGTRAPGRSTRTRPPGRGRRRHIPPPRRPGGVHHVFGDTAPLLYAECRAPLPLLIARAETRNTDPDRISDATAEITARKYDRWQLLGEVPPRQHITIRTDRANALVLADLAGAIARMWRPVPSHRRPRRRHPPARHRRGAPCLADPRAAAGRRHTPSSTTPDRPDPRNSKDCYYSSSPVKFRY
jgi:predicted kinase